MRSLRRIAVALAATALSTGAALTATTPAQAAPVNEAAATTVAASTTGSRAGASIADLAAEYWTTTKMRNARSADLLAPDAQPQRIGAAPTGKPQSVPPAAPSKAITARAVNASSTVGKVFFRDPTDGGDYVCSAGAVNSGSKLLVMSAGHCVHGGSGGQWMQNWVFVPLYNYGSEPYGRWSAKYLTTFNGWINNSSLDRDVAWVTVWPDSAGRRLVDRVGGNGLSVNYSYEQAITILAYPAEAPYDGGWQQYCQGTTSRPGIWPFQENKIQLRCGFTGGSSGSVWLRAYDGNLGHVNGIMSTLNSSGWNKSSYFDTAVMDVYNSVANRV